MTFYITCLKKKMTSCTFEDFTDCSTGAKGDIAKVTNLQYILEK